MIKKDVIYSHARGYWSENHLKENDWVGQFFQLTKTWWERDLELTMDIYSPDWNEKEQANPLVMLLHGGAFFANNKESMPVSRLCRTLAENGFTAVSVNYRMGYHPNRKSIRRTENMALEDARNALRYLIDHSQELGIDSSRIIIGGASSGAITTLKLAAEPDCPHVTGIIDMWGGVESLELLDKSDAALIAFHGDKDNTVPFDRGYPMGGKGLMNWMYGSKPLTERMKEQGKNARLVIFAGYAHAPYRNKDMSVNSNYEVISDECVAFVKSITRQDI